MERELFRLNKLFGGIENLDRIPSLVFIADLKNNEIAAKEARESGIPVIGVLNTDGDPTLVDQIIPANDRNRKGMEFIVGKIKEMIVDARVKTPSPIIEEGTAKKVDEKEKKLNEYRGR